jgi:hypothetical protein
MLAGESQRVTVYFVQRGVDGLVKIGVTRAWRDTWWSSRTGATFLPQ